VPVFAALISLLFGQAVTPIQLAGYGYRINRIITARVQWFIEKSAFSKCSVSQVIDNSNLVFSFDAEKLTK